MRATCEDTEVELVEVSCLGRCDTAPAVAVNERPAPVADVEALSRGARAATSGPRREGARRALAERPDPAGSGVAERYATLRALLAATSNRTTSSPR